jgi:hypothetical protein
MSMFQEREDTFEKGFAHVGELRFRAKARRNKLLGLWAADKLGASGVAAKSYVDGLVAAAIARNADDVVAARILEDFVAVGVQQSEHQIRSRMAEFLTQAIAEIRAGT